MPKQSKITDLVTHRPHEVIGRTWKLDGEPFYVSTVPGDGRVRGWRVNADGDCVGPAQTIDAARLRLLSPTRS